MTYVRSSPLLRIQIVLSLGLLFRPAPSLADDNHYQNYLIGERAMGFGGAYTALSNDSSGAYYNPAGLAEAPYSSISLSASIYGFSKSDYSIESIDFTSENSNFVSYPTTAAWIFRVREGSETGKGRVQLAVSLFTPQSDVSRKRLAFRQTPVESPDPGQQLLPEVILVQSSEDDTLWMGLSAAWKPTSWFSLGLSLFGTLRTGKYQIHQHSLIRQLSTLDQTESTRFGLAQKIDLSFSHWNLIGLFGALLQITEHWSLGATFRTPSLELRGAAQYSSLFTSYDENTSTFGLESTKIEDATFHDKQPFKATLGAAYVLPQHFGVSVDFSIYAPVDEHAIFEAEDDPTASDFRMKKRLLWQVNVGGEYYLNPSFPLRLGFFTNLSSYDPFTYCDHNGQCSVHSNLMTDEMDLLGFSGSLGYETEKATLTLGVSYCFGQRSAQEDGMELETKRSFLFFSLGGTFRM